MAHEVQAEGIALIETAALRPVPRLSRRRRFATIAEACEEKPVAVHYPVV